MALVPFPVTSSAAPAAQAPGARGGAPARPQPLQSSPAPRGPQGVATSDVRQGTAPTKGRPAFAQVLAAARHDAATPAEGETPSVSARRRVVAGDEPIVTVESDESTQEAAVPVVAAAPDDARVVPPASWLLLALETGPMARGEHDTAVVSAEDPAVGTLEVAAVVAPVDPAVFTGNPALTVPVVPDSRPATAADVMGPTSASARDVVLGGADLASPSSVDVLTLPSDGAGEFTSPATAPVTPAAPATAGTAAPAPDASATLAVQPATVAPVSETVADVVNPAAELAAEVSTVQAEPAARPAPEAIARWRAATRALAATVMPRVSTADAGASEPAATAAAPQLPAAGVPDAAAPGAIVRQLAQLLGRGGRTVESAGGVEWTATGPAGELSAVAAEAAATPTARATEVLMRLAQASGETPAARLADDTANASVFGQLMASATNPAPSAAPAAAPAPVAALPPAVGEQVNTHIVSSLKMQWKDGIGEAKLHLRPDAYGAVTVALRVEQGAVTAVVRSDSAQVQEWVLQHQQTLRDQMEAAGLRLDELTVSPDDQRQHEQQQDEAARRRRVRRGDQDEADAAVFESLL